MFGQIELARIDAETFMAFAKRLRSLIEEFEDISCKDGTSYALNLSLYPHKLDYGPIGKYELKKKSRLQHG